MISKHPDFEWIPQISIEEEIANTITHGIGAILSIPAFYLLYQRLDEFDNFYPKAGLIIYAISLVVLYFASTFYHGWPRTKVKIYLRYFDHCSVYFLIAGSFTAFDLIVLGNEKLGMLSFYFVWAIALVGIFGKLFFFAQTFKYTPYFYLAMGWVLIFPMKQMYHLLSKEAIKWILNGGYSYSIACLFFIWDGLKYHHAIFHLFILSGSLCHFHAVYNYLFKPVAKV